MRKNILYLSFFIGFIFTSAMSHAGIISAIKNIFRKSMKPAEAISKLEIMLQVEENILKLGQINQTFTSTTREMNTRRQKLYNENKHTLVNIVSAITAKTNNLKEMAQEELRKLQIEKGKNTASLKNVNDSMILWNGIQGAANLAGGDSDFGQIMNYANNFAANSKENILARKETLEGKIREIDSNILDLRAIVALPSNTILTSVERINAAFRELTELTTQLKEAANFIDRILVLPEKAIKDYAASTQSKITSIQGNLQAEIAALECPEVTAWTHAVSISNSGNYSFSDKLQTCKFSLIEVAQKNDACRNLSGISGTKEIEECIAAQR